MRYSCCLLACLLLHVTAAGSAELSVIPLPQRIESKSGSFEVNRETKLLLGDVRAAEGARYFTDLLFRSRGFSLETIQSTATRAPKRSILFTIDAAAASGNPEGYDLEIDGQSIRLTSSDPRGLLYGAITLWQLLSTSPDKSNEIELAAMRISDAPRLQWRGLLLDSSHSFQSVAFIKRFIDSMAVHKLNLLHWHLVGDTAWRLEIRRYPKLTAPDGQQSKPYYTQSEVREIIEHGIKRNVTIVPGLEMPGHASVAARAYPVLGAAAVGRNDPANLYSVENGTFEFFDAVFEEMAALFPAPFVHVGASEVNKDQWRNSASAQLQMKQLSIGDEQRLQRYFIERIARLLSERNRRLVGWDGALSAGLASNSVITTGKGIDGALSASAAGFDVIVSSFAALNFDRTQDSGRQAQPNSSKRLSLEDVYKFDPAPEGLSAQERTRVIGMQANIWTRADQTEEQIEVAMLPRAAAVAEVAWSPSADARRWPGFLNRLVPQLKRYSSLGLRSSDAPFRVVAIGRGLTTTGDRLRVELVKQTPLGDIRYTVNGSELTTRSSLYEGVFEVAVPSVIKAVAYFNGVALTTPVSIQLDRTSIVQSATAGE